jgi:Protein of unknown function (DUF3187)
MSTQSPVGIFFSRAFYLPVHFLLILLFYSSFLKAETSSPFLTHDQNPLVMIYGLPLPTAAKIIEQDTFQLSTSLNISNTINSETNASESLFIDAETYQLNLLLEYGLNKNWMLRFQLPLIAHNGGFLDSWIDDYHDLLNLPEHIRPQNPINRFQINYQLNGSPLINLQQRTSGIGDASIQLGYQKKSTTDFNLSYWASLKLPTGDAQNLTGSGSTDLSLWLSTDTGLKNDKWLYGNLGFMLISDSDVLQTVQNKMVLFGNAGFQMHPWKKVLLKLQFDSHSAFYDSNTDFLGPAVQITFGGTVLFESSSLDIVVSEDIQTQASPDVTFNLNWKLRL